MTAALGVGGLIGAIGAMALGGRRLAAPLGIALVFWRLPIAFMGPLPKSHSLGSCSRSSVQPTASRTLPPLRCSNDSSRTGF